MEYGTQGYLRPDRIVFASAGSPIARRRRVRDTPAWVPEPDPTLAVWTSNWHPRRSSKRARVDATIEISAMLQEVTGSSRSGEECAVCLQDFHAEETLRAMPCSHAFHNHCISQWLRRSPVCPLCRHRLATAPTPEEEELEEEEQQEQEQEQDEEEEEQQEQEQEQDEEDDDDELEWVDGAIGSESS